MYIPSPLGSLLTVMLVTAACLSGAANTMAQQPSPTTVTFPVTPDPATCTIEPRSRVSLETLLGTPSVAPESTREEGEGDVVMIEIPTGQPANAAIETALITTVHDLYACFNAGDVRRAFALVSDTFLQTFATNESLTSEDIAFFTADPTPVPEEFQTTIVAITNVSLLTSQQAGAFVVTNDPLAGLDTVYITFVLQGERWLVDRVIEFAAA